MMFSFQRVLDIAIPAITFFLMTSVGMDLTPGDFRLIRTDTRKLIVGTLGQLVLPLAALATFQILHPDPVTIAGMMLLACSPAGGISNYYTYLARANVALSVVLTALSCLVAVITMPLLLRVFEFMMARRIDFNVPLRILFGQLLLLLALPVALGIAVRRYRPQFVARHDKSLRAVGLAALACLIGFILHQTFDLFVTRWQSIVTTAALFILLSMIAGYAVASVFRWDRKDTFTLTIEYGVRNVAIATTAAVVILKRTEFATFAATYFLVEAVLILTGVMLYRTIHGGCHQPLRGHD